MSILERKRHFTISEVNKRITPKCVEVLKSRARNGSPTAQSFFKAREIVEQAIKHLSCQQTTDAFKLFRLYFREWDLLMKNFSDFYSDCIEAAMKALDRDSHDADAIYVLLRMDMIRSNEEKLSMANRCIELDPSVPDFHHFLACMFRIVGDYKNGLRAVDRAIELLPNQTDWLYDRATFLQKGMGVREAYLKFISSNPTDHQKYPEACYSLAQIYLLSGDHTQAKAYYKKGLDAEDPIIRLPCYEPVEYDFPQKVRVKRWFKKLEGTKL